MANSCSKSKPSGVMTFTMAILYVVSGVTQPLLVTYAKNAGLADPRCQLYMWFYYLGPASVSFTLCHCCSRCSPQIMKNPEQGKSLSWMTLLKSGIIATIDILAQSINYTGAALAGPTIFAILYSSVTVWTAVQSRIFLSRKMIFFQWVGVITVFGGLTITAWDSIAIGEDVLRGTCLVIIGSMLHALTYVFSEAIMTIGEGKLSVRWNCAIQGIIACFVFFVWQIVYTLPHFEELIGDAMQKAHTSAIDAAKILIELAVANLIHALTFFHTLKYFPGGATSAGVMKGLQAVLVFVATSVTFCGEMGGDEMCFSSLKFLSLVVVVGGVFVFGKATEHQRNQKKNENLLGYITISPTREEEI